MAWSGSSPVCRSWESFRFFDSTHVQARSSSASTIASGRFGERVGAVYQACILLTLAVRRVLHSWFQAASLSTNSAVELRLRRTVLRVTPSYTVHAGFCLSADWRHVDVGLPFETLRQSQLWAVVFSKVECEGARPRLMIQFAITSVATPTKRERCF